jgi:hypothetical protein
MGKQTEAIRLFFFSVIQQAKNSAVVMGIEGNHQTERQPVVTSVGRLKNREVINQ